MHRYFPRVAKRLTRKGLYKDLHGSRLVDRSNLNATLARRNIECREHKSLQNNRAASSRPQIPTGEPSLTSSVLSMPKNHHLQLTVPGLCGDGRGRIANFHCVCTIDELAGEVQVEVLIPTYDAVVVRGNRRIYFSAPVPAPVPLRPILTAKGILGQRDIPFRNLK